MLVLASLLKSLLALSCFSSCFLARRLGIHATRKVNAAKLMAVHPAVVERTESNELSVAMDEERFDSQAIEGHPAKRMTQSEMEGQSGKRMKKDHPPPTGVKSRDEEQRLLEWQAVDYADSRMAHLKREYGPRFPMWGAFMQMLEDKGITSRVFVSLYKSCATDQNRGTATHEACIHDGLQALVGAEVEQLSRKPILSPILSGGRTLLQLFTQMMFESLYVWAASRGA